MHTPVRKLSSKKKAKSPKGPAGRLSAGLKRTLWGEEDADSSSSSGPSKKSSKKKDAKVSSVLELAADAEGRQLHQQSTDKESEITPKKDKKKKKKSKKE